MIDFLLHGDLQKVANGANAIRGNFETVRKFANINMKKLSKYKFFSADFKIFFGN